MHLVAAPTEVANKSAAFAEAVPEPAATPVARCSAVMLASSAMIAPAAPPSTAKSSAILGGEISSLDRIRLAQSGTAAPAVAPVPLMTAVAADLSNEDMRRPELIDQVARFDACNDRPQISSVMPAITDDRLILGSLRLSIRKTPFDQKWRSVSQAGHARGLKRSLLRTGAIAADGPHARVAAINSWVNSKIAYADDLALYRQNDFWASSRETLRRGKGDCEDYAILKMDLLAAMGIDRDKMILVVARDLVRNADHAVLVVQLDDGPVVLDNSTDILLDGRLAHDYRPIMSFASNGKWLHGYAVASAALQPAPPTPQPVATIATLSAPLMPVIALSTPALAGN